MSIRGDTPDEKRIELEEEWREGDTPILITKPSVFGWGMNWQHCHNTIFVGMSDSFEAIFQSTKRFHRHGQLHPVNRHLIYSQAEGSVFQNVMRKERDFMTMIGTMVQHTRQINMESIKSLKAEKIDYMPTQNIMFPKWLKKGGY